MALRRIFLFLSWSALGLLAGAQAWALDSGLAGGEPNTTAPANTLTANAAEPRNSSQTDPAALTPPKGLVAQAAKDKILLAWEPVTTAAHAAITYQIFRSENEKDLKTDFKPLNNDPVKDEFFLDSAQTCKFPPKPYTLYYY
ncbi:MAG: hypothetical protein HGA76_06210, partial [Candidatus Firestonebacteria bacterium]|nr:hypothetical protein [Candidatus Firestonebacteria bacterium]